MSKNKKRIFSLMLIFALVLITGTAYAALNGALNFNGTATLGVNVDLSFVAVNDSDSTDNASSGTMTFAPDGQSATIEATLSEPGESLTFSFRVENTCDLPVEITSYNITNDPEIEIGGTFEDLIGEVITAGDTDALPFPAKITVTWPDEAGAADNDGKDCTFTITLNYAFAA